MFDPVSLGQALRHLRLLAELDFDTAAQAAQMTPEALLAIETGAQGPDLETLVSLLHTYQSDWLGLGWVLEYGPGADPRSKAGRPSGETGGNGPSEVHEPLAPYGLSAPTYSSAMCG